jgi:hypothetical protein
VSMQTDVYHTDFYAWTQEQAALLRHQDTQALDYANVAEEVESVGTSQQQALESHLEVVLTHLLTWCYGPTLPDVRRGWRLTIREQRRRLARLLHYSPSLRSTVPAVLAERMLSSGRKGRPHRPGGWGSQRRMQGGSQRRPSCQARRNCGCGCSWASGSWG